MRSFAERLTRDFSRSFGLLFGFGLGSFFLVLLLSYLAIFSNEYLVGKKLFSFGSSAANASLRVVDPSSSMVHMALDEAVDQDSKEALRGLLEKTSDIYIAADLSDFAPNALGESSRLDATVVIGSQPSFIEQELESGKIYWYSPTGDYPSERFVINHVPVEILSTQPKISQVIRGGSGVVPQRDRDIFVVTPAASRFLLSDDLPTITDLVDRVTCDCSEGVLARYAQALSEESKSEGGGRLFYAVDAQETLKDQLAGPVLASSLAMFWYASAMASLMGSLLLSALRLWHKQSKAYRADALYGATKMSLHMRFQFQALFLFALPAASAFLLVNRVDGASGFPTAFTKEVEFYVLMAVVIAHLVGSIIPARSIKSLFSSSGRVS